MSKRIVFSFPDVSVRPIAASRRPRATFLGESSNFCFNHIPTFLNGHHIVPLTVNNLMSNSLANCHFRSLLLKIVSVIPLLWIAMRQSDQDHVDSFGIRVVPLLTGERTRTTGPRQPCHRSVTAVRSCCTSPWSSCVASDAP